METMTHVTSETVNIKMQNAFGSGSYKPLTKFLAVESVPMIFNVEAECRLLLTDFMTSLKTKSKSFLKTVANNLNNVTFMTSLVVFPVIRGLDELFSKVARNENPTTDEMMSFELMRLSSFHNCPGLSDQSWLRLAQAGFYYPGQGDQLTCFCCGLRRGGWQSGENPMRIHRELSPHCPFVNSQESVNIPVGQIPESGYEHSSPRTDGLASILPGVPHSGSVIHHAAVDTNHGQPDSENNEADAVSRRDQNSSSRSVSTRYTEQIATNSTGRREFQPGSENNVADAVSRQNQNSSSRSVSTRYTEQIATNSTGRREFNNSAQFSSQRNSQNGDLGLPNADGSGTHRQFGHVKYLRYATVPVRVSSYMNWPRYMSQTPQELAVAGFYSAGFGDSVRCFCCGIGLRNWQTGDSPWVEHARYSPTCVYVRMSKGEDFIEMVQAAVRELDEGRSSHTRQGHAATRGNSARTDSVSVSDLGIKAYTGGPEDPFESEAVQSVIEMGYSPHTIQMALGSLVKKSGWSGLDAMSLMEVILEQEDKVQNNTEAHGAEGGSDVTSQSTDIISEDALKEQNRELREKKLCKICFTEALSIVFLPCGHLCCCVQCAQPMKKCPICREVIKGRRRKEDKRLRIMCFIRLDSHVFVEVLYLLSVCITQSIPKSTDHAMDYRLQTNECVCRLPDFYLLGECVSDRALLKSGVTNTSPYRRCDGLGPYDHSPEQFQIAKQCHTGIRQVLLLVLSQDWPSVFILYENRTDHVAQQLMEGLNTIGITVSVTNRDRVHRGRHMRTLITRGYDNMADTGGHFIILCQRDCVKTILSEANAVARSTHRGSEMWQFGKWLVILYGETSAEVESLIPFANDISNVALLVLPGTTLHHTHFSDSTSAQNDSVINHLRILSLLWVDGGRRWSCTGFMDSYEGLVLTSDLFPNIAYGLNRKELIVTTHLWRPFVMSDVVNGTTMYYGLCIDLLNELAEHYNFTYRIVEPMDGEWGRLVGSNWTGMVGQLVKHEVDMMMAPVSMQSERERVIDFVRVPFSTTIRPFY
ncbi:hypothetical protein ScPMuIL_012846 [Solemya velum]